MIWVIYCRDRPNATETILKHRDEHIAYLKSKDHMLFYSGPLQSDDGENHLGSLFIVNCNTRQEAQAFSENEPFTKIGVYEKVLITRARKGGHFHPELGD